MLLVFEHSRSTLAARLVLLALADYAHDDGTKAFPSIATLAQKANVSERSVQYALRKLEQHGEIKQTGKTKGGTLIWSVTLGGADLAPPGVQSLQSGGADSAPDPSREPQPKRSKTSTRKRNQMFDELALACGLNLDAMTKEAARLCGIAASEITKAGGTPDMVKRAVHNYRAKFVGAAATPKAIANHWPEIVPAARLAGMIAICDECGIGGGRHLDDCSKA